MTEHNNAARITEARRAAGALEEYELEGVAGDAAGHLNWLADALHAADRRVAKYAADMERMRAVVHGSSGLSINEEKVCQVVNSATAPDDALREVKADVWDEAIDAACEQGTIQLPDNPYREEQS